MGCYGISPSGVDVNEILYCQLTEGTLVADHCGPGNIVVLVPFVKGTPHGGDSRVLRFVPRGFKGILLISMIRLRMMRRKVVETAQDVKCHGKRADLASIN